MTLVAEAQALLSHSAPGISLDELHLRAMRALVAELKRKKYGLAAPARKRDEPAALATGAATEDAPKRSLTAERANDDTPPEPGRDDERGEHTPDNLTLHCRAHNALAAEQDFGQGFMQHHQRSKKHQRWGE